MLLTRRRYETPFNWHVPIYNLKSKPSVKRSLHEVGITPSIFIVASTASITCLIRSPNWDDPDPNGATLGLLQFVLPMLFGISVVVCDGATTRTVWEGNERRAGLPHTGLPG